MNWLPASVGDAIIQCLQNSLPDMSCSLHDRQGCCPLLEAAVDDEVKVIACFIGMSKAEHMTAIRP